MKEIILKSKYFYISGIVAFILVKIVGDYSLFGGIVAGVWLGFWMGYYAKQERFESQIEQVLESFEEHRDVGELRRDIYKQFN